MDRQRAQHGQAGSLALPTSGGAADDPACPRSLGPAGAGVWLASAGWKADRPSWRPDCGYREKGVDSTLLLLNLAPALGPWPGCLPTGCPNCLWPGPSCLLWHLLHPTLGFRRLVTSCHCSHSFCAIAQTPGHRVLLVSLVTTARTWG